MRVERYIYVYNHEGKPYIIVKFYGNKKSYQKVFTGETALSRAKSWKEEMLSKLKKQGKFRIGMNKHGLPVGIHIQISKNKKGKNPRKVFKISGGFLHGKHLQTSVSIHQRGFAEALKLALVKREQFKRMKREAEQEKRGRNNFGELKNSKSPEKKLRTRASTTSIQYSAPDFSEGLDKNKKKIQNNKK